MGKLSPGQYTRGWESLTHYLTMLRASIRAHLAFSLIGGLILSAGWFYMDQSNEARSDVLSYWKAGILSSISESRAAEYDLGNGSVSVASGAAERHYQSKIFKGRTARFVAMQWVYRLVMSTLLFAIGFAIMVGAYGRSMTKDKHLRGSVIVVHDADIRAKRRRKFFIATAAGMVLGSIWWIYSYPEIQRQFLSDYFWSSFYSTFEFTASWASPGDDKGTAWFLAREPSFRSIEATYSFCKETVFSGASFSWLWFAWLLKALGGLAISLVGLVYFEQLKKSKEKPADYSLAGVPLEDGRETKHMLFFGSPGAGKSVGISELLDQVRAKKQRAVIYDPSGDFIESFGRQGKDIVMNPLDKRFPGWNLWSEIREETDYMTIAASLFPPEGKDPFWANAGATFFSCLARKYDEEGNHSMKDFHRTVTQSKVKELSEMLAGTAASPIMDPQAGTMPLNLLATIASKIAAFEYLDDPPDGAKGFSIRDYIGQNDSDSWMFLTMSKDQRAALTPLVSLWVDIASSAILSLRPDKERRVFYVLDELPSLNRLPSLLPLLAEGRKFGACGVLGVQAIPQLRDCYGKDTALSIASQVQTYLVLRSTEPETAKWLSSAIGEAEIEEKKESLSMGADSIRDGVSLQATTTKKAAVMAEEIMALEDLTGYLMLRGTQNIYKVSYTWKVRKKISEPFTPRKKIRRNLELQNAPARAEKKKAKSIGKPERQKSEGKRTVRAEGVESPESDGK
jgi:type IV conjugative transfer system coupling protein TraD